ncbi:EF-P 5-aminopentanol modification-associated protein YfmH [Lentilactobacillus kosonis]|nr:pitrilysin family protein [Lentilactobacillus kosonis]
MTGFKRTSAVLSVNYGSADTSFIRDGKLINQPAGIAHFLEHKMFDKRDYDVFELFNKNGGRSNAYTSFTKTNYIFSSTDNVNKNLELLLDFVMQPYFTEQKVNREKGIIAQEINMYKNDPDNQLFTTSVQSMYPETALADDIAGSEESLAKITVGDLKLAYDTFYRPENMTLIISGNLVPEEIMSLIHQNQVKYPKHELNVQFVAPQPKSLTGQTQILAMDVSRPKASFTMRGNFKLIPGEEAVSLKYELGLSLLMNLFFLKTQFSMMIYIIKELLTIHFPSKLRWSGDLHL